jgi:hypothetical protein
VMEITSGWSSDYAKKKYAVTLDEADLARILLGEGIPLAVQASITLDEAHTILWASAEIMARRTLVQHDPSMKEQLAKEARQLNDRRTAALTGIRSRTEAAAELAAEREGD